MKKIIAILLAAAAILGIPVLSHAQWESLEVQCPWCNEDKWEYHEIAASCTSSGKKWWECCGLNGGCGYKASETEIPALGHDFSGANPRICTQCGEANPNALTDFEFYLDQVLYTYQAPSTTTITPVPSPAAASGTIEYSVSPAGIVGLETKDKSSIIGNLNTSVALIAVSAGKAVLTLKITDGCGYYGTLQCNVTVSGETVPEAISIEVYPKSVTVEPGKTISVSASVLPAKADQTVRWSTNNPTVATVTSDGVITGVGPGNATVTVFSASVNSVYTEIPVYVPDVKMTSIVFGSKTLSLKTGGSTTVSYEIYPTNAVNKTLTWESSDPTVAYVDSTGCIYGISEGVAVITAWSSDRTVSATCSVTVTNSTSPSWSPVSLYTTYYAPGYYTTGLYYEDTDYAGAQKHTEGALYTRTGYTQTGWSLDYYGRTLDYSLYQAYTNSKDLNLYPYWATNPSSPLKLTINYDSSLGTVYFNGKVFPSGHYWSINEGETLYFSIVPISNYYASSIKLAGRYLSIYNNSFSVSYSDMQATGQSAYVTFTSIYGKPKTGDEAAPILWTATGLLSAAAFVGICGYTRRKKKQKTRT